MQSRTISRPNISNIQVLKVHVTPTKSQTCLYSSFLKLEQDPWVTPFPNTIIRSHKRVLENLH